MIFTSKLKDDNFATENDSRGGYHLAALYVVQNLIKVHLIISSMSSVLNLNKQLGGCYTHLER